MAIKPVLCSESTLTDRYQTTVPEPIRKALGLNKRDKICYTIQPDGQVVISRAEQTENDPIIEQFLRFIAEDIQKNPQHLKAINSDLVSRIQSLVADVDFHIDEPLLDEDE
ncbi:type II toxin-antitoxin system PrlF family antitoxin [Nostoc parmelioides]|uniref:Type II toxin-antitoxin system PrlF family antitoxin n=1 Tax=Nostoc parmelioides FACHB-3921 TaxID=2692909 RepID=A0ABR8BLJ7_9NOSO|nr:type II toxin-antitoxin system PrlF family antitoxin [Nostoc parmelioides]MBD2254763.1 type II toxin-antitoxin system PrlF family antitoxin [Nostoc parmelioides FACHB-3921]